MTDPLADTIRSEVEYIRERVPILTWGHRLAAFADDGQVIADAIDQALKALGTVSTHPKGAIGADVAARARVGSLVLDAAEPGATYDGMTASWALGSTPPPTGAAFSVTSPPTIGYLTITGTPTVDFSGVVEITATGGVGVGQYRFSSDGGQSWTAPATIPTGFAHAGVTIAFSDEIEVPDVIPEAAGELPLFSSYTDGAVASWQSLGFDKLTLSLGSTVETYDHMRPGATWPVEGAARSELVGAMTWDSATRPVPQTQTFTGGQSRVPAPVGELAPYQQALDDAMARGTEWRRRWVLEISDHVVTRATSAPALL